MKKLLARLDSVEQEAAALRLSIAALATGHLQYTSDSIRSISDYSGGSLVEQLSPHKQPRLTYEGGSGSSGHASLTPKAVRSPSGLEVDVRAKATSVRGHSPASTFASTALPGQASFLRVKCGEVTCLLPPHATHQRYLDFFFTYLSPFHPCLNETHFRNRCERLYKEAFSDPNDDLPILRSTAALFLALLFSVYACVDVLRLPPTTHDDSRRPGYIWYCQAQELVNNKDVTMIGFDLAPIQLLILQVSLATPFKTD